MNVPDKYKQIKWMRRQFFELKKLKSSDWPAVLVPCLDLRVWEVEFGRELHAVLNAEVLLALEALLEGVQLVVREGRASLARLLRLAAGATRPVKVRVVGGVSIVCVEQSRVIKPTMI